MPLEGFIATTLVLPYVMIVVKYDSVLSELTG